MTALPTLSPHGVWVGNAIWQFLFGSVPVTPYAQTQTSPQGDHARLSVKRPVRLESVWARARAWNRFGQGQRSGNIAQIKHRNVLRLLHTVCPNPNIAARRSCPFIRQTSRSSLNGAGKGNGVKYGLDNVIHEECHQTECPHPNIADRRSCPFVRQIDRLSKIGVCIRQRSDEWKVTWREAK